ncbi:MAG: hypothetical protein ACRD99_01910, partial [Nitrososphaera sp.]
VALGAGVIVYGGSMFQTNTQHESIQISNTHIWINPSGTSSVAAFVVQNTGGKALAVTGITVRGMSVPLSSWYYNNTVTIANVANVQRELSADFTLTGINVDGVPGDEQFTQAASPIHLAQGQAAIVYMADPAGIKLLDTGQSFTMTVKSGGASSTVAAVHVTAT